MCWVTVHVSACSWVTMAGLSLIFFHHLMVSVCFCGPPVPEMCIWLCVACGCVCWFWVDVTLCLNHISRYSVPMLSV